VSENKEKEINQNEQIQEKKVRVFYFQHDDGLNSLDPILIKDNEKIWQCAVKRKINGVDMYYLFYSPRSYLKLWKDSRDNLLFYIDNYHGNLFFYKEPELWKYSLIISPFTWDNNSICFNNTKITFNIPIFNIVRQLHMALDTPTAYVIYKLYSRNP